VRYRAHSGARSTQHEPFRGASNELARDLAASFSYLAGLRRSTLRTPLSRGARTVQRARVSLLVAVVAVGLLGGPAAATTFATSAGGRLRPDLAGAFIGGINQARASNGRPRLAVDSTLTSVAQRWAVSMSKSGVLSHNPRLATSVRGWQFLGENVGVGYSVASLQQAFWASAEHRSNIIDRDYTRVGVGVVDDGGKLWVVETFSRPAGVATHRQRSSAPDRSRASIRPAAPHAAAAHTAAGHLAVDALTAACATQAARLFRARHWLRLNVRWAGPTVGASA
jgi:uncharacterized protein YkwD